METHRSNHAAVPNQCQPKLAGNGVPHLRRTAWTSGDKGLANGRECDGRNRWPHHFAERHSFAASVGVKQAQLAVPVTNRQGISLRGERDSGDLNAFFERLELVVFSLEWAQ